MPKLYSETYGSGEAIIMLHGWAMHSGIWRSFARNLALNFRVICVDLPGHGRSQSIDPYTLQQLSEILSKIIPDQPCHWIGWSLGASIMLDVWRRWPEKIRSLMVIAGNPHFTCADDWPGIERHLLDNVTSNLQHNYQATLTRFLNQQVQGGENARQLFKDLKVISSECEMPNEKVLQGGLKILRDTDLRSTVASITCPACFVFGKQDKLVPMATGAAVSRLLPNAEVVIIDNSGHLPFLSHQQKMLDHSRRFFAV